MKLIDILYPKMLEECIVAAGQIHGGNDFALVKSRDRNYKAEVEIIRDLTDDNIEILYMKDNKTGYMEGMNSNGIGIINSALLVYRDEQPIGSSGSKDGPRIYNALKKHSLKDAIESLVKYHKGLKGHTLVGDAKQLFCIEMTEPDNAIITELDPTTGFDVRTNHGIKHKDAGYDPIERKEDYISSRVRKYSAEVNLNGLENWEDLAKVLAKQQYEPTNPNNTMRRTNKMNTSTQIAMNLDRKEFNFYVFPKWCDFKGITDNTPKDYKPAIKLKVITWKEK